MAVMQQRNTAASRWQCKRIRRPQEIYEKGPKTRLTDKIVGAFFRRILKRKLAPAAQLVHGPVFTHLLSGELLLLPVLHLEAGRASIGKLSNKNGPLLSIHLL